MTYDQALNYLYNQLPMFQRQGATAYKPGLERTLSLAEAFGNPHEAPYRKIHVAGTNGKGTTSALLASLLMERGLTVGLYTSPHLVDFRERIRVNGRKVSKEFVIDFVEQCCPIVEQIQPSFFELTFVMAMKYFELMDVDVAVIEVGLGGRLDSTNIIEPTLCVITNIAFDHTQFLGNTLREIAAEKAGIIKPTADVVIGEAQGEVREVFERKAGEACVDITFAEDYPYVTGHRYDRDGNLVIATTEWGELTLPLPGDYQLRNANTVLAALGGIIDLGMPFDAEVVSAGFRHVVENTGIMGRWMRLNERPPAICDSAHNVAGFSYVVPQLQRLERTALRIVIGFVADKDISTILSLLPADAEYYFTQASVPRALPVAQLVARAEAAGLRGRAFATPIEAYRAALSDAAPTDVVYAGGSMYLLGDLLTALGYGRDD